MSRFREQSFPTLVLALALLGWSCHQVAVPPYDGRTVPSPTLAPVGPRVPALAVDYLANEGFLIRSGDHGVLVDALFGDGVLGYQTMGAGTRQAVETGTYSSTAVQIALASHYHPDHFDPGSVARFLVANPEAVFISTPQAGESFRRANPQRADLEARFHSVLPAPGAVETLQFDGLGVTVLNLHHGHRDPPVENLGFIVTLGDQRFIHFGDTEATMQDFEPYLVLLEEPDLALLPFWFLASEWRAEMVRDLIRPRAIAVGHLPRPDAPSGHFGRWNSYGELLTTIENTFPNAWIPRKPGEPWPDPTRPGPPIER